MYQEEVWKVIPSFPKYEASSFGRIRNVDSKQIIHQCIRHRGKYYHVQFRDNNKSRSMTVHRLVAEAFNLPKMADQTQVDHIDGNGLNNQLYNLRYVTNTQNVYNGKLKNTNTLGRRGVNRTPSGKFQAVIRVNGDRKYLGTFDTIEDASNAYERRAREIQGEFYRDVYNISNSTVNINVTQY